MPRQHPEPDDLLGTGEGVPAVAGNRDRAVRHRRLIQQATQLGLSLPQVLEAIPLFVPNTLPYTIPATTLFASCVVYGRLSHDNEVVAIKAAGVHLFTILKPALLLGMLTTLVTAGLYHTVIPHSQQMLYKQLLEDPEEVLYNMLRRDRCLRHPNLPYVLYVRDVQGKRLIDVVLKKRAKVKDPTTGKDRFVGYDFTAQRNEPAAGRSGRRQAVPRPGPVRDLRQEHVRRDRVDRPVPDGPAGRVERQGQGPHLGADVGRPARASDLLRGRVQRT